MAGLVQSSTVVLRLKFSTKLKFCASISATSPSRKTMCKSLRFAPPFAHRRADYIRRCVKASSLCYDLQHICGLVKFPLGSRASRGNFTNPRDVSGNFNGPTATKDENQMKMTRYLIIILTLLSLSACSQTKSETDKPKHFLSDDALEFDLVGKIKNIEWIVTDSTVAGNNGEYYKGYYKGTIDSIRLVYDKDLKLVQSALVSRSIKTYDKNVDGKIVFKNENLLLGKYSDITAEDISQMSYRKLIKDNCMSSKEFGLFIR